MPRYKIYLKTDEGMTLYGWTNNTRTLGKLIVYARLAGIDPHDLYVVGPCKDSRDGVSEK